MDSWHATFWGRRHLPREVTAFEIEVFFQFSAEEARTIEERRRPELKWGLALQIGFLRMSGRLLDAVRMVPPLLWRLGPDRWLGRDACLISFPHPLLPRQEDQQARRPGLDNIEEIGPCLGRIRDLY
jgi:uncharacterized protein DUF4158